MIFFKVDAALAACLGRFEWKIDAAGRRVLEFIHLHIRCPERASWQSPG
jgi:hypothetical protein